MKNSTKNLIQNSFISDRILNDPTWPFKSIIRDDEEILSSYSGRYEISETDDSVILEIALPGVSKKEIDLNFKSGILKVEVKKSEDRKWVKYYKNSFSVGNSLDGESMMAKMSDGVLSLKIPKKKDSMGKRIEIS